MAKNNWNVRRESDIFSGSSTARNLSMNKAESSKLVSDKNIDKLVQSRGIYNKYNMDWTRKFSRHPILDPYNTITTTKEYLFFTKPDLCIAKKLSSSAITVSDAIGKNNYFFDDAVRRYPDMVRQLESSISLDGGPFMAALTNTVSSTLEIPGISAEHIETAANVMGTKITYRGTSYKSDQEHEFNLEFEDTKYLDIYMLFKMYDEYEKLKWNGALNFELDPNRYPEIEHWQNYIVNKVLHDQISIYKFIVAEDGYRILYWARITGCYPTSIPRDAFSDMSNNEAGQKLTVGWKGHFVRDMDPVILYQFNNIVAGSQSYFNNLDLPLYSTDIGGPNPTWAASPYVHMREEVVPGHGTCMQYYLRWKT